MMLQKWFNLSDPMLEEMLPPPLCLPLCFLRSKLRGFAKRRGHDKGLSLRYRLDAFCNYWLQTGSNIGADLNHDGKVNFGRLLDE